MEETTKPVEPPKVAPVNPYEDLNIDNLLLSQGKLFLLGEISEKTSGKIIKEIHALNAIEYKPIIMFIDSPGGWISSGLAICDTMRLSVCPIITMVMGQAASMAAVISVMATDIKNNDKQIPSRYIMKNARMLVHSACGGIAGDDPDTVIKDAQAFLKEAKIIRNIVGKRTKLPSKMMEGKHEIWLSPKQCLKYGIVHKII